MKDNDIYKDFGKRLADIRKRSGMTQSEVACRLETVQSTYAGYELGVRRVSLELIKKLANIFNVSPNYLILGEDKNDLAPKREVDIVKERIIKNVDQLNDQGKQEVDRFVQYQLTINKKENTVPFYGAARGGDKIKGEITEQDAKEIMDYVKKVQKDIPEF